MPTDSIAPLDSEAVFLSGDEAEAVLGVPALGFIPLIDEPGLRLIRDISHFSPLMESFRSFRVNIGFVTEKPPRSLAITSSVPAEGKSTVAANLAMALAMRVENNRIVIVDADLRRPSQHKQFKIDSSPGLVDVLVGTHSVEQALRPTSVPNVWVLPAGTAPMNPTELLESKAMKRLLIDLTNRWDTVLLDTPPLLAVADAAVVASLADAVLVVIGYGETTQINAQKTLQILSRAKATVLGTVLNRMAGPAKGYYYGKYYVPTEPTPKEGDVTGEKPKQQRERTTKRKSVTG